MKAIRFLSSSLIAAGILSAIGSVYAQGIDTIIIAPQSTWKYNDSGQDLGTEWRETSYNDNSWPEGMGVFGYGGLGSPAISIATPISFGPNASSKYITYYFRHEFEVTQEDLDGFTKYKLNLLRDDGAVVYINGKEVRRDNMPLGHNYLTLATSPAVSGTEESTYVPEEIASSNPLNGEAYLEPGTNVIAIEVHQQSATSSDMGFDFEFLGNDDPIPPINFGAVFPPITTGFQECALGDQDYRRDGGEVDLEWSKTRVGAFIAQVMTLDFVTNEEFEIGPQYDQSPNSQDRQLGIFIGSQLFRTERIDVRSSTSVKVSIDVRQSGSGGNCLVDMWTSADGILFVKKNLVSESGANIHTNSVSEKMTFESTPEQIPDNTASLYLEMSGSSNANSAIWFDNITVTADQNFIDYFDFVASFGLEGDDAAQDADPDCDGILNIMEYGFGGDPTNGTPTDPDGNDIMPKVSFEVDNEGVTFAFVTYRQRTGIVAGTPPDIDFGYIVNDMKYTVQVSQLEADQRQFVWEGGQGSVSSVVEHDGVSFPPLGNGISTVKAKISVPVSGTRPKVYVRVIAEYVEPPD